VSDSQAVTRLTFTPLLFVLSIKGASFSATYLAMFSDDGFCLSNGVMSFKNLWSKVSMTA